MTNTDRGEMLQEALNLLNSYEWAARDRNGHECCPSCWVVDTANNYSHSHDCEWLRVTNLLRRELGEWERIS